MLRAGFEFFAFTPRREENVENMFLRFDMLSERAQNSANLGISYPFRAWMVLALLRLEPHKWGEYLREIACWFSKRKKHNKKH